VLRDPRDFEPIYVGKGNGRRIFRHWIEMLGGRSDKNRKLYNKLTTIFRAGYSAPIYEKWLQCDDEKACFLMERFLINTFERKNLCNLTDGGDGASGAIRSAETRQKMSKSKSADHNRKVAEALRGRIFTAEHRRKISESGRRKIFSAEHRQNLSKAGLGRIKSAEECQKLSVALLGHVHSPETRQKLREAWVVRRAREERAVCI
jgi:NUMOD3 motif